MKVFEASTRHNEDAKRIMKVAIDNNILMKPQEAEVLWSDYSEVFAAGWLYLPEDDEPIKELIFEALARQMREEIFWEDVGSL